MNTKRINTIYGLALIHPSRDTDKILVSIRREHLNEAGKMRWPNKGKNSGKFILTILNRSQIENEN